MAQTKKQITYKGLDEKFQCRGYQFEVGKTYLHQGEVKVCDSGFHSCVNPFDVLNYYDITQRFAITEIGGSMSQQDNGDSNIASAEITIKAELSLPMFIATAIEWMQNYRKDSNLAASGYGSKLAASGYGSKLAASGDDSNLAASGHGSKLAASGYGSKLAASGYGSKLAASGYGSVVMSAGLGGRIKVGVRGAAAVAYEDVNGRIRIAVGHEGENIEAGIWYVVDQDGEFIPR